MNKRLLVCLLICIISKFSSQVEVLYKEPNIDYIPFELSNPNTNLTAIQENNFKKLLYLIGFLPTVEQYALFTAYSVNRDTTRLFNITVYDSIMKRSSNNESAFKLVSKRIASYLTAHSFKLRLGLGCLLNVYTKYNKNNSDLLNINTNVIDILNSQIQANNCRSRFGIKLLRFTQLRRRFLFTTIKNQEVSGIWNDEDKKDFYIGFKFTNQEVKSLTKDFIEFVSCEHTFQSTISSRVLEIQQLIAQIPGCKGEDNFNAGVGSFADPINVKKTYNSLGQQIGVNNGNGIRPDGRTQNNYLLLGGFGLGNGGFKLNKSGFPAIRYGDKIQIVIYELNKNLEKKISENEELLVWSDISSEIKKNLDKYSTYRPTPQLHSKVLLQIKNLPDVFRKEFRKAENGSDCKINQKDIDYIIICNILKCRCAGDGCPMGNTSLIIELQPSMNSQISKDYKSNNTNFSWNFNYSKIYLSTFCLYGKRYIFTTVQDNLVGNLIDFIYSYKSSNGVSRTNLGGNFALIQQGCLATFYSGQKNDKDACRDSVTDECGNDIDHKCKLSGLYDYINSNPVAGKFLPLECDESSSSYSEENCFIWINKNFLSGTMTLKSSGFLSVNLSIQNSQNNSNNNLFKRDLQSNLFSLEKIEILPLNTNDAATEDLFISKIVNTFPDNFLDSDFSVDGAYNYTFPAVENYLGDVVISSLVLNSSGKILQMNFILLLIFIILF